MIKSRTLLQANRGISLIEAVFYMATLAVVLNLGTRYLFQTQGLYRNQEKCLNQIVRAMVAGRRIKRDIEECKTVEHSYRRFSGSRNHLIIRKPEEVVVYQLREEHLLRVSLKGEDAETARTILEDLSSFHFQRKTEGDTAFVEINFELTKSSRKGYLEPLFTFKAVPGVR